jgi:hypothetical protein
MEALVVGFLVGSTLGASGKTEKVSFFGFLHQHLLTLP